MYRIGAAASYIASGAAAAGSGWHVYVVETRSGKLYTGITTDITRRLRQHAGHIKGGAKSMRGDPPVRLRYAETAENRSVATRREMAIKSLSKREKTRLVAAGSGGGGGETSQKNTGSSRGIAAEFFEHDEKYGGGGGVVALPAEELEALDPFLRTGADALGSDVGTTATPGSLVQPVERKKRQQLEREQRMFPKEGIIEDE